MDNIASSQVIFALLLTLGAGLSTGIGSCVAFFFKHSDRKFLSFALGFSGGVMIYISLAELLADAKSGLIELYGHSSGSFIAISAFFSGIALAMLIDRLIPSYENPHEVQTVEKMVSPPLPKEKMLHSGILLALALGIHNFPEGMAVFITGLTEKSTAVSIAIAIAIHNIPEGITVSVPIYHATGSRKKAFLYSALSGVAEPCGAIVAWLFLAPFISATLLTLIFAAVAGIMVYISFDELLPLAEEYGEHHLCVYGTIAGMLTMAVSLAI